MPATATNFFAVNSTGGINVVASLTGAVGTYLLNLTVKDGLDEVAPAQLRMAIFVRPSYCVYVPRPRYVRITNREIASQTYMQVGEVEVMDAGGSTNVARGKTVTMAGVHPSCSTFGRPNNYCDGALLVDGIRTDNYAMTESNGWSTDWMEIDLGAPTPVSKVEVFYPSSSASGASYSYFNYHSLHLLDEKGNILYNQRITYSSSYGYSRSFTMPTGNQVSVSL